MLWTIAFLAGVPVELQPSDRGDLAVAIERIQSTCPSCTLDLDCGEYEFQSTADVCSSIRIIGCGTGRGLGGTRIRVTRPVTAFRVWHKLEDCPVDVPRDLNAHLTLEHLGIYTTITRPTEPMFGIDTKALVFLEDVHIRGFTQGLRGACDVRHSNTGCNLIHLDGVWIDLNEHAGVYLAGGDSNAGVFSAVNSMQNCYRASIWPELGDCANIIEASFLGNTWVGAHTATARDVVSNTRHAGVLSVGASQRSAWIGLYTEADQATNRLSLNSSSIGGLHSFDPSGGIDVNGFNVNRLRIMNQAGLTLQLGRQTNDPDAYLALEHPENSWHLRLSFDRLRGYWYTDVGNTGLRQLRILEQCGGGLCGDLLLPGE